MRTKRIKFNAAFSLVLGALLLITLLIFNSQQPAAIHDKCLDWKFPKGISIHRYDPCSSLTLIKITEGREIKANFVFAKHLQGTDSGIFGGKAEEVVVDGKSVQRSLYDGRESDNGLGNYHEDYRINYNRIMTDPKNPDGLSVLSSEFILATKDNTHVSDQEIADFISLTNQIMEALMTK